jgi:hypothetical protein
MLDSGFHENQTWGALHKAWKGYVIAKNKDEYDKLLHYANAIQELEYDLGLQVRSFPDIGKSALAFYSARAWEIAQQNKIYGESKNDCCQEKNQEALLEGGEGSDEIDRQYEQERYNDTWNENYTGDPEFEKERYADDNAYSKKYADDPE